VNLQVKRLDPDLPEPRYARQGDAGLDLYAATDVTIAPGARVLIGTGIAVAIPDGFVGFVTPRSGLAVNHGLSLVNSPGVVDAGYRGEIKLILINTDPSNDIVISRGERVAQLVVAPFQAVEIVDVVELPSSERGEGGHGSTGKN
jgi:dUTP pyrophosphatase